MGEAVGRQLKRQIVPSLPRCRPGYTRKMRPHLLQRCHAKTSPLRTPPLPSATLTHTHAHYAYRAPCPGPVNHAACPCNLRQRHTLTRLKEGHSDPDGHPCVGLQSVSPHHRPLPCLLVPAPGASSSLGPRRRICLHGLQRCVAIGRHHATHEPPENGLDKAPTGSFVPTLKTELVHHRADATHNDARRDLFVQVEGFYNGQRLHSGLGYKRPDGAERRAHSLA